jgi:hypothetical protein
LLFINVQILKKDKYEIKSHKAVGSWWLTPVILAAQEAENRKTEVQSWPREIVLEKLSRKYPITKRVGTVDQAVRAPA